MNAFTLDDRVARNPSILGVETDEREILLMDEDSGNCFALGGSGLLVWRATEQPIRVRDICAALRTHYRIDEETCATQTLAYVAHLAAENLLRRLPDPE